MAKISPRTHLDNRIYPAYKILNAVETLAAYNVPAQTVLSGTTLKDAALRSVKARITLGELATVYQNIQKLDIAPDVAFRIGGRLGPYSYGAYGFAVAASESLAAGLDVVFAHPELATPAVRMSISIDQEANSATVVFQDNLQFEGLQQFNLESHTAMFSSVIAEITGSASPVAEAWFSYPEPDNAAVYEPALGCRCRFGMPRSGLVFPKRLLSQPLAKANPITAEAMRNECVRAVEELRAHQRLTIRLLQIMHTDLRSVLTMEQASQTLGMSPRTLRRHLADEGASFKEILSEYRLKRAVHLLKNRRLTADDVAHELGYGETSNFRAAFKKWTGLAVGEFIALND